MFRMPLLSLVLWFLWQIFDYQVNRINQGADIMRSELTDLALDLERFNAT